MEYRYWNWGQTKKRDDYRIAALRIALEKTSPSHGPYTLSRVAASYSTQRLRREVFEGTRIHVHVGPWRSFRTELLALHRDTTREFLLENPFLPARMRVTPGSFRK